MDLTPQRQESASRFRRFADEHVRAHSAAWDAAGRMDTKLVAVLAQEGLLAPVIAREHGGAAMDDLDYGLLCRELSAACSSTRSLVTVQGMVAHAIQRWGTPEQHARWLPGLASGDAVAGFCLTEEQTGSDAASVQTTVHFDGAGARLTGRKLWTTFGQIADLFLVIGTSERGPTAVVVPKDAPGLRTEPVQPMLGLRAAMLATVVLDDCEVPADNVLGKPGFGFSHVASTVLDHGRHSIAWGCAGIARDCLESSAAHASTREQFGFPISEHQLVRRLVSRMVVGVASAEALCEKAAAARMRRDPDAILETMSAKYLASRVAWKAASDAVQVHGAAGCTPESSVQRHLRDARIMRIIEGTDQMLELTICDLAFRRAAP
ncbi:MAG TPA: acyl-CoA dehydrogenase family protein [Actinomycetota bacterium]|nr:acyl-CoA dehydrogenase family protein [Actinomycetota bacterium]